MTKYLEYDVVMVFVSSILTLQLKYKIMTRNELKTMWFNLPTQTEITKTILVELSKSKEFWVGYGEVTITSDGPNGYRHYKTHQEFPLKYALNTKEYKSGEYQLAIK